MMMIKLVTLTLVTFTQAISSDFFSGVQTGVFVQSDEAFADYSCPMPVISDRIKQFETMVAPMKTMFVSMTNGKDGADKVSPFLDTLEKVVHQGSIVISLFASEYDAGDFCKGLIFAKEVSQMLMKVFGDYYNKIFSPTSAGEVNPAIKQLMGANMNQ